ncbi:MAG: hypothetical protein ACYCZS_10755 [Thiobacillus sp.]
MIQRYERVDHCAKNWKCIFWDFEMLIDFAQHYVDTHNMVPNFEQV